MTHYAILGEGGFQQLCTYVMFTAIIFWVTAACAVFTLRKNRKSDGIPRGRRSYDNRDSGLFGKERQLVLTYWQFSILKQEQANE